MNKDFGYYLNMLQNESEQKIKYGAIGMNSGGVIKCFLIPYFLFLFVFLVFPRFYIIELIVFSLVVIFLFYSRYCLVGITKDNFIFLKIDFFRKKVKKRYEVALDEIKYIDIKKTLILRRNKCYLSFLENNKKIVRLSFIFFSKIWGKGFREHRKNANEIYELIYKNQKVLEKGDF